MSHELTSITEAEFDELQQNRAQMLTAGTQACEFLLNFTSRDDDTGELRIVGGVDINPQMGRQYYSTFTIVESSGLDTKAALGISEDEVITLRQLLFDKATCD